MTKTTLSLEPSRRLNLKVLRLEDTSHYSKDEKIENLLVEVLPVNQTRWLTYHVGKTFSLILNSSSLQYAKASDHTGLADLPDGIYEIKQSYKPNLYTAVHFYHFRTVKIRRKLADLRYTLDTEECKLSDDDYRKNRDMLRDIEEYVDSSEYAIEEKNDKKKGKDLYQWAEKLIEKYANECKC